MHYRKQWVLLHARVVSIPTALLIALASVVVVLSKLSVAAASDSVPERAVETSTSAIRSVPFAFNFEGIASYYAHAFHGRRTAQGTRFNMYDFSAAHCTLPFGTILRVTNPQTGETILVHINDRGPFIKRRVLDLSYAAAQALNLKLGHVRVEGFTPRDISADSLLLVFCGSHYQPYRVSSSEVEFLQQFENFSLAFRAHRMRHTDPSIALAVLPASETEPQHYAVVRLSPLLQWGGDSVAALLSP